MNIIEDKAHPALFWQDMRASYAKLARKWMAKARTCYMPFDVVAYNFALERATHYQRLARNAHKACETYHA